MEKKASFEYLRVLATLGVIKLFEGLPKFMRVSREGLTLLECQFMRVWFEGLV